MLIKNAPPNVLVELSVLNFILNILLNLLLELKELVLVLVLEKIASESLRSFPMGRSTVDTGKESSSTPRLAMLCTTNQLRNQSGIQPGQAICTCR